VEASLYGTADADGYVDVIAHALSSTAALALSHIPFRSLFRRRRKPATWETAAIQ
jgi:hypothetical protein